MNTKYTKELLESAIKSSKTKSQLLSKLGLRHVGGNFYTINKYIKLYNLDISHFDQYYQNDVSRFPKEKEIPLNQILIENSNYSRKNLKKRLYKENLKQHKCEFCGQDENWNGKHMSLILDHINGIWNDNRLENLRIVCPNCNATLDTHAGKNIKRIKKEVIPNTCITCGKPISKNKNVLCKECSSKQRRVAERPSKEILIQEIKEKGYSATGRKYGVSDNSIRKWLK